MNNLNDQLEDNEMDTQWEMMNKRLVELEETTRVKVENLNVQLAEKNNIINQLNAEILQLRKQTASAGKTQALEEQLGVFQEMIAQLETEKRELQNELQQAKDQAGGSAAQSEQLGVFQEMIKQLETEKRELQTELQQAKEKAGGSAEQSEQLEVYKEMIKQLETEKRDLDQRLSEYQSMIKQLEAEKIKSELKAVKAAVGGTGTASPETEKILAENATLKEEKLLLDQQISELKSEIENLNNQIADLTTQVSQIEIYKADVQRLENKRDELRQKVQTLESQAPSEAPADTFNETISSLRDENENLKLALDKAEKEIDDLITVNRDQSEKISALEQDIAGIASAKARPAPPQPVTSPRPAISTPTSPKPQAPLQSPPPTIPSTPRTPSGKLYFSFENDIFIQTTGKSPDVTLTLDETTQKWELTIEPGTSFLKKNKALRIARSLPNTGWKDPKTGERLGKDYEITVKGEY